MLSVVDGSLAPVLWEDLDPASSGYTLDVLKDRLRPQDAVETTPGGDEYVVLDAVAPKLPCYVPNPHVVSKCGLSGLPSSIYFDDEADHDPLFVQTCVELAKNVEYASPQKLLMSLMGEEPLNAELDPGSRLRDSVDSERRVVAKRVCYARPARSSWPLKQGSMGDVSQLIGPGTQDNYLATRGGSEVHEERVGCPCEDS